MKIEMRERECGFYEGMGAVEFRRLHSIQNFTRHVELKRYAIDETPVTNAQFAAFLKAADYRPKHTENFLKHWVDGHPPAGKEDHPVVYVDLDDARAYAAWAGKRLPTEEEWQYAAQGTDGRKFPWGGTMMPDRCNDGQNGRHHAGESLPQRTFALRLLRSVRQRLAMDRKRAHRRPHPILHHSRRRILRGSRIRLVYGRRPAAREFRRQVPHAVARPRPLRHRRLPLCGGPVLTPAT